MDRRLTARGIAAVAALSLVPTALRAADSRMCLALAVFETALLALATAYAVYLGLYRYSR